MKVRIVGWLSSAVESPFVCNGVGGVRLRDGSGHNLIDLSSLFTVEVKGTVVYAREQLQFITDAASTCPEESRDLSIRGCAYN